MDALKRSYLSRHDVTADETFMPRPLNFSHVARTERGEGSEGSQVASLSVVHLMAHQKNPQQSSGRQHQIIKHKFPEPAQCRSP